MPDVQIASAPPRCHCEEERRSNPGEGEEELQSPQKLMAQIFPLEMLELFRTATMGRILTLRSPLDQHNLMDRFVVPPRDDSARGCIHPRGCTCSCFAWYLVEKHPGFIYIVSLNKIKTYESEKNAIEKQALVHHMNT